MVWKNKEKKEWTTIIEPEKQGLIYDIQEIWTYRDLIGVLVRKDLQTLYAQTILGPVWFLLNSLLSTSVLTAIFGGVLGLSTQGAPQFLFYMSGAILWNDFSGCVSKSASVFRTYGNLMSKVYFPRLCVVFASILSRQVQFIIQFIVFFIIYIIYNLRGVDLIWRWSMIVTPLLMILLILLALGIGLIVAAITVRFRDAAVLLQFALQIWMYITPVVYPASQVDKAHRFFYLLNPVAPILEAFRAIWLDAGEISFLHLSISGILILLIGLTGISMFQKVQRTFVDRI